MRLDQAITQQYHLTRNRAQQLIDSGLISVNGKMIKKASYEVKPEDMLSLQEDKKIHWVSRSAEKLHGFLETSPLHLIGKTALDVGSSTGGFTQVLLERGVSRVDAVDVGTDQFHISLRSDSRISLFEQTDIRDFSSTSSYDIIVCDASFISLREICPSIFSLAGDHTDIILLFKPQFEVGKEHLRKTGVPKDPDRVVEVMSEFEGFLGREGIQVLQKVPSILQGEAGNQEWLYWVHKK